MNRFQISTQLKDRNVDEHAVFAPFIAKIVIDIKIKIHCNQHIAVVNHLVTHAMP